MEHAPSPAAPPESVETVRLLLDRHAEYRASSLNLIASENVISPAVAAALMGDLEGRYADYNGVDLGDRKYRGGRFVVELETLCSEIVCQTFGAEACELRAISGHVAGSALLLGLCEPGDLVLEVPQSGGGHRLGAKLAQARLVDLNVEFLPFDSRSFTVDADAARVQILERRPKLVILGSSSFVQPHPVREVAAACAEAGSILAYDASHVMGFLASQRFQDPLREGAQIVFGSTHKTLFGPQGGLIFGARDLVDSAAAGLYPPLVTNHHPFRLPALIVALAEHAAFGAAYVDQLGLNVRAFEDALRGSGISLAGSPSRSHTVLVALEGASGEDAALRLEASGIICNQTRLPDDLGASGLRFGLQELTRRGGLEAEAARAGLLVADVLAGSVPADDIRALAVSLPGMAFSFGI